MYNKFWIVNKIEKRVKQQLVNCANYGGLLIDFTGDM